MKSIFSRVCALTFWTTHCLHSMLLSYHACSLSNAEKHIQFFSLTCLPNNPIAFAIFQIGLSRQHIPWIPIQHSFSQSVKHLPLFPRLWRFLERVMGIEPTQPAWKAGALPLSYTRVVEGAGFEPAKVNTVRFTVWCRWPLGYPSDRPLNLIKKLHTPQSPSRQKKKIPLRKLSFQDLIFKFPSIMTTALSSIQTRTLFIFWPAISQDVYGEDFYENSR